MFNHLNVWHSDRPELPEPQPARYFGSNPLACWGAAFDEQAAFVDARVGNRRVWVLTRLRSRNMSRRSALTSWNSRARLKSRVTKTVLAMRRLSWSGKRASSVRRVLLGEARPSEAFLESCDSGPFSTVSLIRSRSTAATFRVDVDASDRVTGVLCGRVWNPTLRI